MSEEVMKEKEERLKLIPKVEMYIEYMLCAIIKLPRTEKFNIGTEYKTSMYKLISKVMMLNKINRKRTKEILDILNTQRIYLRIMKNNKWIDEKKFKVVIEQIYEIGKILGGLIKYYAKNNKEQF